MILLNDLIGGYFGELISDIKLDFAFENFYIPDVNLSKSRVLLNNLVAMASNIRNPRRPKISLLDAP